MMSLELKVKIKSKNREHGPMMELGRHPRLRPRRKKRVPRGKPLE